MDIEAEQFAASTHQEIHIERPFSTFAVILPRCRCWNTVIFASDNELDSALQWSEVMVGC